MTRPETEQLTFEEIISVLEAEAEEIEKEEGTYGELDFDES